MPTDPLPDPPPAEFDDRFERFSYEPVYHTPLWTPAPASVVTSTYDALGCLLRREPPDGPGDIPPDEPHVVG